MLINRLFILFLFGFVVSCTAYHEAQIRKKLEPIEFVDIPSGTFMMGDFYNQKDSDALPLHKVTVKQFAMSKYETTYSQYDTFAKLKNMPLPDDMGYDRGDRAVVNINWFEAKAFCECYGYRLPTEAEWEYVARSGGKDELWSGTNDYREIDEYARHVDNSLEYSFYVGEKNPNDFGLYDMTGNVYEWIGDYYPQYPDSGEAPVYADYSITGIRIIRGGSFGTNAKRNYTRVGTIDDMQSAMMGFRCVKESR